MDIIEDLQYRCELKGSEIMQEEIVNSIGTKMKLIPVGEFMMGSEDNLCKPIHKVITSKPFYMSNYPVTRRELNYIRNGLSTPIVDIDHLPAKVCWHESQSYIKILNKNECTDKYRLPSEAEWEYACKTELNNVMYDNIWVLVQDKWHDNYEGAPTDGRVWKDDDNNNDQFKRVVRSGQRGCTVRAKIDPFYYFNGLVFHLVKDV